MKGRAEAIAASIWPRRGVPTVRPYPRHAAGFEVDLGRSRSPEDTKLSPSGLEQRAGEGNRTLMTSLEGWGSAIELRPRGGLAAPA